MLNCLKCTDPLVVGWPIELKLLASPLFTVWELQASVRMNLFKLVKGLIERHSSKHWSVKQNHDSTKKGEKLIFMSCGTLFGHVKIVFGQLKSSWQWKLLLKLQHTFPAVLKTVLSQ